ncbi:hypothetical protein ACS0TY_013200 [Phlomoides rotata]
MAKEIEQVSGGGGVRPLHIRIRIPRFDSFSPKISQLLQRSGGSVHHRATTTRNIAVLLDQRVYTSAGVIHIASKLPGSTNRLTVHLFAPLNVSSALYVSGLPRWLGALDGTLIDVTVPEIDKARYRTRKGTISVNVLAVCDRSMRFVYMLTGWEGSAADTRKDPNARHMRHKSWPLYADWCEIFGQSRATGYSAQSHLNARMPPPSSSAPTDVGEGTFRVNAENVGDSQTGENDQEMGKTSSSDRKHKLSSTSDPFVNVVHNFCNTASDRLGKIAQRIGHDQDMSTSRKNIYSSVSKMDTLTLQEKLCATTLIARHAEDIDVFFSLPDDDRKEWVLMLLNGDI